MVRGSIETATVPVLMFIVVLMLESMETASGDSSVVRAPDS